MARGLSRGKEFAVRPCFGHGHFTEENQRVDRGSRVEPSRPWEELKTNRTARVVCERQAQIASIQTFPWRFLVLLVNVGGEDPWTVALVKKVWRSIPSCNWSEVTVLNWNPGRSPRIALANLFYCFLTWVLHCSNPQRLSTCLERNRG